MTRYIDMSDAELASYALNHPTAVPKLCYALAKRLEEVSKTQDAAVNTLEAKGYEWRGGEQWAPPLGKIPDHLRPNTRPPSLADLYEQRGLSKEARQWLKTKRPEVWRSIQWAKIPTPQAVASGDMVARLHQSRPAQQASLQNAAIGGGNYVWPGSMHGLGSSSCFGLGGARS